MIKKDILAVTLNAKDDVVVYTENETKKINGKAYFIINKLKNNGGIQLGDNTWVKPEAIIEMKPIKNGYGLILSNGEIVPLPKLSSKTLLPKRFVEKKIDNQQKQRV